MQRRREKVDRDRQGGDRDMEGVQGHTVIGQEDDRDCKGNPMERWDSEWNTSVLSGRDWNQISMRATRYLCSLARLW